MYHGHDLVIDLPVRAVSIPVIAFAQQVKHGARTDRKMSKSYGVAT